MFGTKTTGSRFLDIEYLFSSLKTIFSFDWAEVFLLIDKIKHSYLINADHILGTVLNAKKSITESICTTLRNFIG